MKCSFAFVLSRDAALATDYESPAEVDFDRLGSHSVSN
ncbi:hypothetical protein RISK_004927 [Rhodopirellula islandica]|uniref:Uncharacterized protein n=1 Tax=Rhodopirellula islandica TaxID=595434 RepID=A0A0J1B8B3_RHOIS|nr:hypothetical protein RISK_004927 [Rhodopirellula islandica]